MRCKAIIKLRSCISSQQARELGTECPESILTALLEGQEHVAVSNQ
jgi:hypothetical protein